MHYDGQKHGIGEQIPGYFDIKNNGLTWLKTEQTIKPPKRGKKRISLLDKLINVLANAHYIEVALRLELDRNSVAMDNNSAFF